MKKRQKCSDETRARMSAAHKGKRHSAETRAKISVAHKGKTLNLEHRAKLSATQKCHMANPEARAILSAAMKGNTNSLGNRSWLGRTHNDKSRAKMSAVKKGKKPSAETRAKLSAAIRGPKHPQWLGGMSISRQSYGWEWNEELREEVRRRDNYKCQLCGAPQLECIRVLHVHHIDYVKTNSDPVNLVALCHSCHTRTNTNRVFWTARLQQVMLRKSTQSSEC